MRNQAISKDAQFEAKMKDLHQLDSFIDVKAFMKRLNHVTLTTVKRKQSNISSESEIDYKGIVQRSKQLVTKQKRARPEIQSYLQHESPKMHINQEERENADQEKFYNRIDMLIHGIHQSEENQKKEEFYEKDRQRQRASIINQPKHLIFERETVYDEKDFIKKSQKVLRLLEKTSKQLFSGKKNSKSNSSRQKSSKRYPSLDAIDEIKNRVESFKVEPNSKHKHSLPELITAKMISRERGHTEVYVQKQSAPLYGRSHSQFEAFIVRLDETKKEIDKMQPTQKQITRIQRRMDRKLNKLGNNNLQSLKHFTKRVYKVKM